MTGSGAPVQDPSNAATVAELQRTLNPSAAPYVEAAARGGTGVFETLTMVGEQVVEAWS